MDISILMATWNNAKRLRITFETLEQCPIPAGVTWEVVVVNNNCKDDTDAVAKEFASRLPLVYVHEPVQGLSRARNAGLAAASGDWIIFTDDDVRPCREWIESYWSAIQTKGKGFYFGGSIESEFESARPDPQLLDFAPFSVKGLELGNEERLLSDNEMFISANWACPRQALEQVGHFDTSKGLNPASGRIKVGEEDDLMNRLKKIGLKPYYLPKPRLAHFVPADKVTPQHIRARYEAGYTSYILKEFSKSGQTGWAAVPRWLLKRLVKSYLVAVRNLVLAKLSGRPATCEYIYYRGVIGQINGIREWLKEPPPAAPNPK